LRTIQGLEPFRLKGTDPMLDKIEQMGIIVGNRGRSGRHFTGEWEWVRRS
jgi:hypothetical protein